MTNASRTIVPVILSGGSGTRLWPASRLMQPKQLLPLVEERSMLRATVDRVAALETTERPIIVTNKDHADATTREMVAAGYPDAVLILEPVGRNTAPAIAVAAHEAIGASDPLLLILPADHTIRDAQVFQQAIRLASETALDGYLVTFGITPSHPETGYGYIKVGEPVTDTVSRVAAFKEKPDDDTAAEYVASGEYLWNSGMFLMKASRYLEELAKHAPDIATSARAAYDGAERAKSRIYLDEEAFRACRSDSIDYAVMERTSMAAVLPTDPGWNDVGSWASLWEIAEKDEAGNVLIGDVTSFKTTGSYVRGSTRLIATVGIDGVIIVDTPDALLVAARDSAQEVKEIVDSLQAQNRVELRTDGTVLRPWGGFQTVSSGPGYRVLRLWLDPGSGIPIQVHPERSTQWLVVQGTARITIGEMTRLLSTNEFVHIPPGEAHRLENPGEETIEVIEVGLGSHIEEDDATTDTNASARPETRR
ncbi:MAG: mannose-1-phosphate guanylyltransferase/mannose-6-phosphate isomerase [Actinomycetota bacterium]|nr:mannose-1-phosphate guanylyltransferase/mannose-6-phosphate isomerase [Actinomycetota bacterium]